MKKLFTLILILSVLAILTAESNPVSEYYTQPSVTTYSAAVQYCLEQLQTESSPYNTKIQLAGLAVMEANRLAGEIAPVVDSLDTGGLFQYANLLLAQKRYQEAITVYQKINNATPAWSCPWRHKGEAWYRLNDYKAAMVSFQKAVETNREHYDAYLWLARTQYQLKKYKPALENLEIALTLNPESENSPDEMMSESSIKTLHEALLKKTGKRK